MTKTLWANGGGLAEVTSRKFTQHSSSFCRCHAARAFTGSNSRKKVSVQKSNRYISPNYLLRFCSVRGSAHNSLASTSSRAGARHAASTCCRQITGQAAIVSRQPLATYNWPESRPDVLQWLEQSIQYAVQKLDNAPFLELVHPHKHDTQCSIYPIDEAVVESPQVRAFNCGLSRMWYHQIVHHDAHCIK